MPDKDEFTFDDGDDFPEDDLSGAFSDGEHEAPEQEPEEDADQSTRKGGGGGGRSRILLMVLLLVVAIAAGAYYFMGLGETTPGLPPAPTQVAAPAPSPAPPAAAPSASVAVPVPPPPAPEPAATPTKPEEAPAQAAAPPPPAEPPAASAAPVAATATASAPPVSVPAQTPAPEQPEEPAKEKSKATTAAGPFMLDAGSYMVESNRDALVKKIRGLGYDPLVTPIKRTVNMTRLNLGTYPANKIEEALAFARTIEPGAFSAPAGDSFVIYAGTFLQADNVEALKARYASEGIRSRSEPVQVEKTLSRIRFGSFATREEAAGAATEVAKVGVKTTVVKGP